MPTKLQSIFTFIFITKRRFLGYNTSWCTTGSHAIVSLLGTWILHHLFFMSCFAKLCKKWERGFCSQPCWLIFVLRAKSYRGRLKVCQVHFLPQLYVCPRMPGRKHCAARGVWCCGVFYSLGVGGTRKKKCQGGRSEMVVGFCFVSVVISHVVLVGLLRPWESLPNAVI